MVVWFCTILFISRGIMNIPAIFLIIITKAVVYTRFSTDRQREKSIDAQPGAIREYAMNNNSADISA